MNSKPKIAKDVFTACLTAAESGDIDAMFYIGYCYYYGEGTRANRKKPLNGGVRRQNMGILKPKNHWEIVMNLE